MTEQVYERDRVIPVSYYEHDQSLSVSLKGGAVCVHHQLVCVLLRFDAASRQVSAGR